MKYIAKVLSKIDNGQGYINSLQVGVFKVENKVEEQIGEYVRNYSSLFNTFCHLQKDGKDFALYSPDYTVTRIMELPSCKDIGGEEPNEWGFCPVDYFVPTYIEQESSWETINYKGEIIGGQISQQRINNPKQKELKVNVDTYKFIHQTTQEKCVNTMKSVPLSPLYFYDFGFIAGCIWGDDSSWKIQYLDLSKAEKGVLKREERFGYLELPNKVKLKKAIKMYGFGRNGEDYSSFIRINHVQTFDMRNGKAIDPFE